MAKHMTAKAARGGARQQASLNEQQQEVTSSTKLVSPAATKDEGCADTHQEPKEAVGEFSRVDVDVCVFHFSLLRGTYATSAGSQRSSASRFPFKALD